MKKDIHPKYYRETIITCSCGQKFSTGSTIPEIHVEVCSHCHPFYSGKQKLLDTAKRVEKFKARADKQRVIAPQRKGKKVKRAKAAVKKAQKKKKVQMKES